MRFFSLLSLTLATSVLLWPVARASELPPEPLQLVNAGHTFENRVQGPSEDADDESLSLLVQLAVFEGEEPALEARRELQRFAVREGGKLVHEYTILPGVVNLRGIPPERLAALEALPGVVRVQRDYRLYASLHQSVSRIQALQSQITDAGLAANGAGQRICVIDTGIDTAHLSFSGGRIDLAASFDFVNDSTNVGDLDGHGTHVTGIAAGNDGLVLNLGCGALPFQGVAPESEIIVIRALDGFGSGSASDVIAGINRCASPDLPGGPADVINMSLGGGLFVNSCDFDSVAAAANNAVAAGLVVVAAAGNEGVSNGLPTPACGSSVIAVGATYDQAFPNCEESGNAIQFCLDANCVLMCTDTDMVADQHVCSSNRSLGLDVVAPGCLIHSAAAGGGSAVMGTCGTSMSAPHVAGLAALLLSANDDLVPAEVRQLIRDGAVDLGAAGLDSFFGYGRVDAVASLELATASCAPDGDGDGQTECQGDCDDTDPELYLFAPEQCDGVDNDCDLEVDEGFDPDGDLLAACMDNCPADANPAQGDFDDDGNGDVCEVDALLADIDLTARVDGLDLARLGRAFGSLCVDSSYDLDADLDRDTGVCAIDGDDLALFAPWFGQHVEAP